MTNSKISAYNKVLSVLADEIWKDETFTGDPIAPTLAGIQQMAITTPEPEKNVTVESNGQTYRVLVVPPYDPSKLKDRVESTLKEDLLQDIESSVALLENKTVFPVISRHIIRTAGEPSEKQMAWLHSRWKIAIKFEGSKDIKHPLKSVVRAWIQTQTAKHVTAEYDHRYPHAVLKHPIGSVRELAFTENDTGRVFQTPERIDQVQTQLDLGLSILPVISPLQIVQTSDLKPQTRSGAVSHELRIFFEAMMALEPNQQRADLMFRLGDLIDFLYPNRKFHWTNQMPHIKRALGVLHYYATVPWIDDQGSLREWRPVVVRSPLSDEATRDTPIFIEVQMPPDAKRGYMVIKNVHRYIGMKSAAQWNAYHVAAFLWDKYGTMKGNLVDPTRPVEKRDDQNRLLDRNGKPLVNRNGRVIKNPYHPEAVQQLEREPNRDAIKRYPLLTYHDLTLACFPNGYEKGSKRVYLQRAKKHWQHLENDGIVVIHKEKNSWRILPSSEHLNAHRALRNAKKGVY